MPIPIPEPGVLELQRAVSRSIAGNITGLPESSRSKDVVSKSTRSYANWDPLYPSERLDWYDEYIARHAKLSTSWLEQPNDGMNDAAARREIRGLAFQNDGQKNVIAPLDDGSVCVWNIGPSHGLRTSRSGRIIARSKPELLWARGPGSSIEKDPSSCNLTVTSPSTVECVSIDPTRNCAYFAIEQGLNEVDLTTLQLVSHREFDSPIVALSEISPGVPLTVATYPSLQIHDSRVKHHNLSNSVLSEGLENPSVFDSISNLSQRVYQALNFQKSRYGPHQGPLAVVHLPDSNGLHDALNGAIYAAGRDPSISVYDRRVPSKLSRYIHSGAHLSSLAVISPLVQDPVASSAGDPQYKIVACGEYKGKGSLELYNPCHLTNLSSKAKASMHFKNRSSASSSKLLSVIQHGARILFSDGNGKLKWVERDGSTLVRHWNINQHHQPQSDDRGGIFASSSRSEEDDVARKLLRTGDASCSVDPVLFWTGEKIGLVGFRLEPWFGKDEGGSKGKGKGEGEGEEEGGDEEDDEGADLEAKAEIYRARMRRALERQADEVRFVSGLGLGG